METHITTAQIEMAYNAIIIKELDTDEINDLAIEFGESAEFGRSKGSAIFLLNRLHILIHGIAPHGETEKRAEIMFQINQSLEDFAQDKGIETELNILLAREDLQHRPVTVKFNKEDARSMMASFYKQHKLTLPKNIVNFRDSIIKNIMAGKTPKDSFQLAVDS